MFNKKNHFAVKFREKNPIFVVTGFVKTCNEFIIDFGNDWLCRGFG